MFDVDVICGIVVRILPPVIFEIFRFVVTQSVFIEFQIGLDRLHNSIQILPDPLACAKTNEKQM